MHTMCIRQHASKLRLPAPTRWCRSAQHARCLSLVHLPWCRLCFGEFNSGARLLVTEANGGSCYPRLDRDHLHPPSPPSFKTFCSACFKCFAHLTLLKHLQWDHLQPLPPSKLFALAVYRSLALIRHPHILQFSPILFQTLAVL